MDFVFFIIFLFATFGAAATGAMFPTGDWYKTLNKPTWVPPNWVFPVAWTSIYLLISFAGARVAGIEGSQMALAFWALQIAFNTLWTPVFFGLRALKKSLPIMACLWIAVLGCLVTHFQIDFWAGMAFVPYMVWVTVAAALNFKVVQLNPDQQPLNIAEI
jgi:tryptophan-rich sensory protein